MKFLAIFLFFGLVCCELDTSSLNNKLNEFGVEGQPIGEEQIEKGQKAFEDQCRKYGGDEAVERGKVAQTQLVSCVQSLINFTLVQQEIEHAKPTGDLDIVFKKYCGKTPQLMDCATNMTKDIEGCLAEDQKKVSMIMQDVAKTLLNFTCFKEGDRIALFIAEGGPECLESKQEDIQKCLNDTFGKYVDHLPGPDANITDLSNLNLPMFLFDEGQCNDIDEASKCVVRKLEGCKDPTPANVVESILKVIRKAIPCKKPQPQDPEIKEYTANAAATSVWGTSSLLLLIISLYF